jgi:uncharacterized protein YbaP (TraB family)
MDKYSTKFGRPAPSAGPLLALLAVLAFLVSAADLSAQTGPRAGDKSFLWSVSDSAGVRLYILGSIHLAKGDIYPLNPVIEEAFARSNGLVVEVDTTKADPMSLAAGIMEQGFYLDGTTLWDHLDSNTAGDVGKVLGDPGFAEVAPAVPMMRPWLAAMTLEVARLQSLGYDEKLGVDFYFMNKAASRGIGIGELETSEEQLAVFSDFSGGDDGLRLLQVTLMEIDKVETDMESLFRAWSTGDAAAFDELYFSVYRDNPEFAPVMDRLINGRNITMANRLTPYLDSASPPSFVVIGAAHLNGPRGVLALLAGMGYRVEQM